MEDNFINGKQIYSYLPNRYPFIMIDKVDELIPNVSAKGYKYITANDWFFQNLTKTNQILPQSLQIECLEELLILCVTSKNIKKNSTKFVSVDVKFFGNISLGDKLTVKTKVHFWNRGILKGAGFSEINGKLICEAKMVVSFPEIVNKYLPKRS